MVRLLDFCHFLDKDESDDVEIVGTYAHQSVYYCSLLGTITLSRVQGSYKLN